MPLKTGRELQLLFSALLVLVASMAPLKSSCHDRDEDGDGVNSCDDLCPGTGPGIAVDSRGCPCGQLDDDRDGFGNCEDLCPGADDALDRDADGIPDCRDACNDTGEDAPVGAGGCDESFVNWESPHVHPLERTPGGDLLLAVNTADARLEVFDLRGNHPGLGRSIPVGLEPVTVRARTSTEAWVVNHISDSISIVDLVNGEVSATIRTGDAPADVVFAGSPERAFVSISGEDRIDVYDPENPGAPVAVVPLEGAGPMGLATDGTLVHAALFRSGNATTLVAHGDVSTADGPYAGRNPPPNRGDAFHPPMRAGNPSPPPAGMIVRRSSDGRWMDDNGADWSSKVFWTVSDHDLASLDARTLDVRYTGSFLSSPLAVAPGSDGRVWLAGTDARNEIRFEPNLKGVFLAVKLALLEPEAPGRSMAIDLNPHITYLRSSIPIAERAASFSEPRGIVRDSLGRTFLSGMGSNGVLVLDLDAARIAHIPVGQGPTGLLLDENRGRLYVLDRFENAVSVVDTLGFVEVDRVGFFDPTPAAVRRGRAVFHDARGTSGLGHVSCASCHIDARTDNLAWDLGNPSAPVKALNQPCSGDTHRCADWHPMKGPLLTQSLAGIMGTEPFHWRGDREDLASFNMAFQTLLGGDDRRTEAEISDLAAFLVSTRTTPNPFRMPDGTLPEDHPNGGNPRRGEMLFHSEEIRCVSCHSAPRGAKRAIASAGLLSEPQGMNVPHLLGLRERAGIRDSAAERSRGFGFTHDGGFASITSFLLERGIDHSDRAAVQLEEEHAEETALDLEAYVQTFSTTHPATGLQVTRARGGAPGAKEAALLDLMVSLSDSRSLGLIAKGRLDGLLRGWVYTEAGSFQSDRAGETVSAAELLGGASGQGITFTAVPYGARIRMGIDRDLDGVLDRDELDACATPFEADVSGSGDVACETALEFTAFRRGDANADGAVDLSDGITVLHGLFGGGSLQCADAADANDDGANDISDPVWILNHLFLGGPEPAPPWTLCGPDFTRDGLRCESFTPCDGTAAALTSSVGIRLAAIPAGSFRMGSPAHEEGRDSDETPHAVSLTRAFFLATTEVTRFQYARVMGGSSGDDCPSCPVTNVAWMEAVSFCDRLTERDRSLGVIGPGERYRLPTEAEWEYACRAGTDTPFYFGAAEDCAKCEPGCVAAMPYAWWCAVQGDKLSPVGRKLANPWGLHDMHGNAAEWCLDWYSTYPLTDEIDPVGPPFSSYRTARGGSANEWISRQRSAARRAVGANDSLEWIGFRVVLARE